MSVLSSCSATVSEWYQNFWSSQGILIIHYVTRISRCSNKQYSGRDQLGDYRVYLRRRMIKQKHPQVWFPSLCPASAYTAENTLCTVIHQILSSQHWLLHNAFDGWTNSNLQRIIRSLKQKNPKISEPETFLNMWTRNFFQNSWPDPCFSLLLSITEFVCCSQLPKANISIKIHIFIFGLFLYLPSCSNSLISVQCDWI